MDSKDKLAMRMNHLEMIQAIVSRLANNSLMIKSWGITIVTALLALGAAKDGQPKLILLAFVPLIAFTVLDSYYLVMERNFRAHYDRVREHPDEFNFEMNLNGLPSRQKWFEGFGYGVVYGFWIPLAVGVVGAWCVLSR